MKIIILNTNDQNGGAARAAYRLHFSMKNIEVDSLMLVKNKFLSDQSVIPVSVFDKRPKYINVWYDYVINKIKNKIQQRKWRRYPDRSQMILSDLRSTSLHGALRKTEFDILHLHWVNHRFLNIGELINLNKPVVWTLHDAWPFTGICHITNDCIKYEQECGNCPQLKSNKENDLSREIWQKKQKIYNQIDLHIVAPSKWLAACAGQSSLFKSVPVTVIPNGIDTDLFAPANKYECREELRLPLDKKYILFGAMQALSDVNKGFDTLTKTLTLLKNHYSSTELELLIIGADEPLVKPDLGYTQHYFGILTSEISIAKAYNAADVTVVPSFSENLSNTIMENLSCGIPVVAFDIGGNGDMIEHQINGYLAKPYIPEDLVDGIIWCLDNKQTQLLSENARNKVLQNFSQSYVSLQYKKLYSQIIHA